MNKLKRFFKELKRVRWPSAKEGNKTFFTSMIFMIICSLILFVLAISLAAIWIELGVGING